MATKKLETVFGTPRIEVEDCGWDCPFGWRIWPTLIKARNGVRKDSADGCGQGGYLGPIRPLQVYEIPISCLPESAKKVLRAGYPWSSDNHWNPKFSTVVENLY